MVTTVIKRWSCEQASSVLCESPKVSLFLPPRAHMHWRATKTGDRVQKGIIAAKNMTTLQSRTRAPAPLFEMFGFLYSLTPICFQWLTYWTRKAFVKHPTSYPQQELQLKSSKGTPGPSPLVNPRQVRLGCPDISLLNTRKISQLSHSCKQDSL